jgi:hypothetical protein
MFVVGLGVIRRPLSPQKTTTKKQEKKQKNKHEQLPFA